MTLSIGRYQFEGPYQDIGALKDRSGVYVILDQNTDGYYPIDVGGSSEVKTRIENHDREECWQRNRQGTLNVAVCYTPNFHQSGRVAIEQEIRDQYGFACGVR